MRDVFLYPERYRTALDIAGRAGIAPVTMYRQFRAAGLPSPKQLLMAARLQRVAAGIGAYQRESVTVAARRAGYRDLRGMRADVRQVFNCSPTQLANVGSEGVHERLARAIRG